MTRRWTVVQSEHLSDAPAAWLAERCNLVLCSFDNPRFVGAIRDADALVVRTYTVVDEAMLARAPRLRVVGRAGVGLDNIDIEACRARGIRVVHTPDANTQAVVEYVVALMCDALRPRIRLREAVDSATWNRLRAESCGERQMSELTLGIFGLGRVGKRVAQVARAIGFDVIYNDLIEIPLPDRHGARPVELEELFARSDVLSIHIDGRASNRGFVGHSLMARMKPDVVFLNTSRGFVVDAGALADFLRANPGAQAHLDVHEPEPFPRDDPLLRLSNAYLYPHLASRTRAAMENMSWVVRDVLAALERS